MTQVKFDKVVRSAREWLKTATSEPIALYYQDVEEISRIAGYEAPQGRGGYSATHDWESFTGQVKRAFDKLASEGELVRVSTKDRGPDGRLRRYTTYWFPARYQEVAEARAAEKDATAAENGRKDAVTAEVQRWLGEEVRTTRHLPDLTLAQWQRLLEVMS